MIFITVKMPNKIFDSKKKDLLEKVSKSVAESLNIPVESVAILIDDTMSADNFAVGGKQFEPLSKQLEQAFTTDTKMVAKIPQNKTEETFTNDTISDCISSSNGLTDDQKAELFEKLISIATNPIIEDDSEITTEGIDYIKLKETLGQTMANNLESTLKSPQLMKQTIDKFYEKIEEKKAKPKKTRKSKKTTKQHSKES